METILNEILDCSKLYVIQYYDDLKTKIDIEFETKLQDIHEIYLKEEISKKWVKIIEIIDKCLVKCKDNTIPNELVEEAKILIDKTKNEFSNKKLEEIVYKLQSHLFSNDSCLAIFIPKDELILITAEGISPNEIEYSFKTYFDFVEKRKFNDEKIKNYNLLESNTIYDNECDYKQVRIIYLESFTKKTHLTLCLKDTPPRRNNIELKFDHLRRFSNLKFLMIVFADIENLEIFSYLKNLEKVIFSNCYFKDFDSIRLKELSNLNELSFFLCGFNEFDSRSLVQLKSLKLISCYFTNLEKEKFTNLINLEKFHFDANAELFQNEFFANFIRLKELKILYYNVSKLEKNTFVGLENLLSLDLSESGRLSFEKGCFNGLKNLKELNLKYCYLDELDENILSLENLEVLKIGFTNSKCLKRGSLKQFNKLKELRLFLKEINDENKYALEGLDKLEILDLSNNRIVIESSFFNQLKKLKSLDLSNCRILEIPENFFLGLDSLEYLNLNENQNMLLRDGCFNGLKNLIEIKKFDDF